MTESFANNQVSSNYPTEQTCPQCGNVIPVNLQYVTWCDRCNWNVEPPKPNRPQTIFESLYESMGRRFGQRLFNELSKSDQLGPRLTLSLILGFLLATLVHAITISLIIAGLIPFLTLSVNCLSLVLVAFFWGLAWVLVPRLPKMPTDVYARNKLQSLYQLTDRIAEALNAPKIDGIVIDWNFNAGTSRMGWRQKRILYIGLPLFTILAPQERIGLIAHELAHSVNGDLTRGFFIGAAIDSLVRWYNLWRPDPRMTRRYGLAGMIANFFLFIVSRLPYACIYALLHLLWRDTQRAEYLADVLSAEVSGTPAAVSALNKLHLFDTFVLTARRVTLSQTKLDFFAEFQKQIEQVPARELDRVRRLEQIKSFRLDASHPPTIYRLELMNSQPVDQIKVKADPIEAEQIDQELSTLHETVQRQIADKYHASLYG